MAQPLRILLIEDLEDDALLLLGELRRGGYEPTWERVDTAAALSAALGRQTWDIIACDWVMPRFSAPDALKLLKQHGVDIPIIIVSGEVGEEVAITAMKAGAHDYVSKFRLQRLVPAIDRELREARERRARRQSEEALERERELVTSVLDTVGALVGVVDREGRIVRFNRACEQTLGYSFDEVRGRPFWDLLPMAGEVDPAKTIFERLLAGKWPMQYETYWYTRQGGRIRLAWSTRFLSNEAGEVEYVIGSGIDITERKRSEDALQASETRFRSLIEKSLDLIAIIDANGNYRYVNPAHEVAYGRTADEMVGTSAFETLHPDDARELPERLAAAIRSGETMATVDYRIRHKDGSWHPVEGMALNLFDDPAIGGLLVTGRDITERRLADQRVTDALNYTQTMLDASPVGIITYSASGDTVSTNEAAAQLIGATIDQVKVQNFRQLESWRVSGLLAAAEKALATGEEQQIETRFITSFGNPVWLAVRLVPFQFEGERRLLTLSTDIGERKRAEEALAKTAQYLLAAQSIAHVGSWEWNVETGDLWWSDETYRIFGLQPGQVHPSYGVALDFAHPHDRERYEATLRRAVESGERFSVEIRIIRADATEGTITVAGGVFGAEQGQSRVFIGVVQDISERKHAEQLLQTREQQQATIAQLSQLALSSADLSDLMREVVQRSARTVQAEHCEVLELLPDGETLLLRAGPDWLAAAVSHGTFTVSKAFPAGHTVLTGEPVIINDTGADERFSAAPLIHALGFTSGMTVLIRVQGKPFGVLGAFSRQAGRFTQDDLHFLQAVANVLAQAIEQKLAEDEIRTLNESLERRVGERTEELMTVNEELEAFSYSVSHDLRAPLRHIAGFSRILLQDYAPQLGTEVMQYLDRIEASTQHMGQLIEDLLNLSRVTRTQMVRQAVHLSDLAQAIAADLQSSAPNRSVEFVIAPGLAAEGDPRLLRVALDNLLGNAWKYTSKHPAARIEFGASECDGEVVYSVRDDGAGFDMTDAAKLFRAFQRFHSTSEFEGTGVGLAIVQRIIRRHGGRIWAESEVGKGATFCFTLGRRPAGRGSSRR